MGGHMPDSVYKVIELVGTSTDGWEQAVASAVALASQSLRDLRVGEVSELDVTIENGKVSAYRAKVNVSFKYEGGAWLHVAVIPPWFDAPGGWSRPRRTR